MWLYLVLYSQLKTFKNKTLNKNRNGIENNQQIWFFKDEHEQFVAMTSYLQSKQLSVFCWLTQIIPT